MALNIKADTLEVASANITSGAADPRSGGGTAAPVGSLYLRSNGTAWMKTGAADTDWSQIGSAQAGFTKIEVIDTLAAQGQLVTGLQTYYVLPAGASTLVELQFAAAQTTNQFRLLWTFQMSAASANAVRFDVLGSSIVSDGENPDVAPTNPVTLSQVYNDALLHVGELIVTQPVTKDDIVYVQFARRGDVDTNPNEARLFTLRVSY